jgi:hypothetical protein
MRQDASVSETALQMTLFPLLQQVDPSLYDHICVRSGLRESGFALSWVTGWFASDVGYVAVGSRLIDVFLVSHPLMPVYGVVALLVSQRRRLLSSSPSLKSVYANLRSLKLMATLTMSNDEKTYHQAMKQTEEIIASALQFIKKVPPQALIQLSQNSVEARRLSAIVMLSETASPSWCVKDTCPTEWGVLQRARAKRIGHMLFEPRPSSKHDSFQAYTNAFAAAGYKPSTTTLDRSAHFARRVLAFFGLAIAAIMLLSNPSAPDLSTSLSGRLTMFSHHRQEPILPTISADKELPTIQINSSDAPFIGASPVEPDDLNSWIAVVPPRHEILASSAMHPAYELTDCERDFERFILEPLHAVFAKHANIFLKIVFNRLKGKAMIIVPATRMNHNDFFFSHRARNVDVDPTQAESIPAVNVLANYSAVLDTESFALVLYNQTSAKTRTDRFKAIKEKVVFQTSKVLKVGRQALSFAVRAVRTTMVKHVALFDESAGPPSISSSKVQ